MTLLSFVHRGRDQARSISSIAEASYVSRRKVEKTLESLVLSGIPIVASDRGVYIEEDPDAIDAYADQLEARIASQLHRIRALRRAAEKRRQPMTLWREVA